MFTFLKEVRTELYNVSWPKRMDIGRLTFVVIAISILVGIYLGVVDLMFTKLLELIIA